MKRYIKPLAAVAAAVLVSPVLASTGPFTGPLTGAALSVDMNGGPLTATAPTEGWNGSFSSPSFSADPYGVMWTGWGGPTAQYGDGTQLPSSQSSPNVNASSISKSFGSITATISIDVANNSSKYGTVNGVASMNSRDRGIAGVYSPAATGDTDMFRDFLFAGGSGSQVQGENYLQLSLSGLTAGGSYQLALYSYDSTGSHSMNWTRTAPTTSNALDGWWDPNGPQGNNTFVAPGDQQTITWTAGTTPAPAVFTFTADGNGDATVWGYGGTGSGQSGDTSYLDGFQITPEPSSIAFLGLGLAALFIRSRKA